MAIKIGIKTQTTDLKITFNSSEKVAIDRKVVKKNDLSSDPAASTASRTESTVAPVLAAVSDQPLVLPLYPSMTHYESTYDPKNSDFNAQDFINRVIKGRFKKKRIQTIADQDMDRDIRTIHNNFPQIAKTFDNIKKEKSPASKLLKSESGAKIEINIEGAGKTITVEREGKKRKFGLHEDPKGVKKTSFFPMEGSGMVTLYGSELKGLVEKFQASGQTSFVQFALKMKKDSRSPEQTEREVPPAKEKPAFSLQLREERQKARNASRYSYASKTHAAQFRIKKE